MRTSEYLQLVYNTLEPDGIWVPHSSGDGIHFCLLNAMGHITWLLSQTNDDHHLSIRQIQSKLAELAGLPIDDGFLPAWNDTHRREDVLDLLKKGIKYYDNLGD